MLIITADDFGRSVSETDAAIALARDQRITSVSAMVFMEDSERAAVLASTVYVDVGLHLNFSEAWTSSGTPKELQDDQGMLAAYFKRSRYAQVIYNPALRRAFRAVYEAQVAEFRRLYGREPSHIDGHHHKHLCANMLVEPLIPRGLSVRRNFSFRRAEKSLLNRTYRKVVDTYLSRRYVLTDYFFSLELCLDGRGQPVTVVAELARTADVEVMTHPKKAAEFDYLCSRQFGEAVRAVSRGTYRELSIRRTDSVAKFAMVVASLYQWL